MTTTAKPFCAQVLTHAPEAGARLITSCLGVVSYALSWNFDPLSPGRALSYTVQDDAPLLTPPAAWADALLSDAFVAFLLALQTDAEAVGPEAPAAFYPVYIQLASVAGRIFGADPDVAGLRKRQHFDRMLALIFAVLRRAAAAPEDDPEAGGCLVSGCQAYARLVHAIEPVRGFFASERFEESCAETHRLTVHVMTALARDPSNHFFVEALDALLGVWVTVVTDDVCQVPSPPRFRCMSCPTNAFVRTVFFWGGGAGDAHTAHPATFSTAPAHQRLGSANAETTPAGAPAAAADRTQRPDATCEGKNG